MSMAQLKYKRVLLKISGEALAGDKHFGFDFDVVSKVCDVIKKCSLTADDGASSPMKWCKVAADVVHWATMRGNYSGMPLRLRMVFSENPL